MTERWRQAEGECFSCSANIDTDPTNTTSQRDVLCCTSHVCCKQWQREREWFINGNVGNEVYSKVQVVMKCKDLIKMDDKGRNRKQTMMTQGKCRRTMEKQVEPLTNEGTEAGE